MLLLQSQSKAIENRETDGRDRTTDHQHQLCEWRVKWTAVQMGLDELCTSIAWQKLTVTKGISAVSRETGCKTMKLTAGVFTHCR